MGVGVGVPGGGGGGGGGGRGGARRAAGGLGRAALIRQFDGTTRQTAARVPARRRAKLDYLLRLTARRTNETFNSTARRTRALSVDVRIGG